MLARPARRKVNELCDALMEKHMDASGKVVNARGLAIASSALRCIVHRRAGLELVRDASMVQFTRHICHVATICTAWLCAPPSVPRLHEYNYWSY